MMIRSQKIKDSARGQDCTLRLPGICNFNDETTVLSHIGKVRGMGMKCNDYFAVYACSACHHEIDRRTRTMGFDEVRLEQLRALEETLASFFEQGLLKLG
ncbi:MAG: DUF1364 domain-containing protein [Psychrobium sp.]|nr:DUF1364 domain-containing protein [Psychrobium sp.]